MRYVIWGAGERGARVFSHLKNEDVCAFIDSDEKKRGKEYLNKPIISFEEYKRSYLDCYIIISIMRESEIEEQLKRCNIYKYFLLTDCPGEYQTSNPSDDLEKYIKKYLERDKRYAVYGCTVFSIYVSEWIKEKTGKNAIIIPHNQLNSNCISSLQGDITTSLSSFKWLEEIQAGEIDEILVAIEDMDYIRDKLKNGWKVKNIYDCSRDIETYYNPLIEKYKNIYKGKRCFIVATGPSLKVKDLEMLNVNNEICISMNHIWKAFKDTNWRPTYYIADDWRAINDVPRVLENLEEFTMFLGDTNKEFWQKEHPKNIIKHHFNYEYSEKRYPKFSEDFARQCYMGSTVTYSCMQLAVYMGFKEIYLLGVDFSYANSKMDEKYTHFFKEDTLSSTGYVEQVTLAYQAARAYADVHGIRVYNATRGGKLEVFERVDFDSLFPHREQ